jgi:hypothetical protein
LGPASCPCQGGWSYGGAQVRSGLARFWVNSDRAGTHAAEVRLTPTCDLAGATQLPLARGGAPVRRYQAPTAWQPPATVRYYVLPGGCVRYRFSFSQQTALVLFEEADQFLGFTPRLVYVDGIRGMEGLTLCGPRRRPALGSPAPVGPAGRLPRWRTGCLAGGVSIQALRVAKGLLVWGGEAAISGGYVAAAS